MSLLLTLNLSPTLFYCFYCGLRAFICLLYELFYISIVFRFADFTFHPFLERISTKYNISTKWNAQGPNLKQWNEKCISKKFQDET